MLWKIRTTQIWSLSARVGITVAALGATFLFQIPLEREVPGEPFLLFFLVVICATLAFGRSVGLAAVGLSTFLSIFFFEPFGSLAIHKAADVIKIEFYAFLAGGCVIALASLAKALITADDAAETLKRSDASKSMLLRELSHGVANNFASVAALISLKSAAVRDAEAKSVLQEAVEQVSVMARVHRRLRAANQALSLDSETFMHELCDDLNASVALGRSLSIECKSDRRPLCMDQAVLLGLIVNELVTNAIKHAFPDGRAGRIRVGLEAHGGQLRLTVEDDGIGFNESAGGKKGMGQDLVRELTCQLGGKLESRATTGGSSFQVFVPYVKSPEFREFGHDPVSAALH